MLRSMADRRWDGDEQGNGVADASHFANGAAELLAAMRRPNWVAEQPEMHLLPHLERACEPLPLQILSARTSADGCYDVELAWTGDETGLGVIRAAVFALLGGVAEPATYVRQRRTVANDDSAAAAVAFDVVTGIVDELPFTPHGHTLRLSVVAPVSGG
jgi:hypothetical protein